MNDVQVLSEIGQLQRVIIHRPDAGIARISPRNAEGLLFDDIVHLPQMQDEHDIFSKVLRTCVGEENVLEAHTLLYEALEADAETKEEIIRMIVNYEELPKFMHQNLIAMSNVDLAETLITGYDKKEDRIYFDPIPNFIFTRDIAVIVHDHVIITKPFKTARFRENFLTRFIFWSHPLFKPYRIAGKLINLNHVDEFPPSKQGEIVSMEGGDMMMIHPDYLLIGHSERTSEYSIQLLKNVLFEKGIVKNVVQVNIPKERSFMHIDTVFTQINTHHIVAYAPVVIEGLASYVEVYRHDGRMDTYDTIKEFFVEELDPKMEFILSGRGISPYQEREQWTDGCNLVAIRPGVALTYDRNPVTEKAFTEFGYTVITANEFLTACSNGQLNPKTISNTIITLPSNELSRARGGSHCMTCPIKRAAIHG